MGDARGGPIVMAAAGEHPRRHRPLGVVILVLIQILIAVLGALALIGIREAQPGSGRAILLESLGDLAPVYGVLSVIGIIIAIGLWRLAPWGWYAAMVWTGVGLAWQILLYLNGHESYIYMLVYVVEAFYLNQREVKRIFEPDSLRAAPVVLENDTSGPS
jgi:amino acid transporter